MGGPPTIRPRPGDPSFAKEWGLAWSTDPNRLTNFYAPNARYTDAAMQVTVTGAAGLLGFHAHMAKFIADSVIRFDDHAHAAEGHLVAEWTWSGTVTGPLRLHDGRVLDLVGRHLTSTGVAVCRYGNDGLLTSHVDYWDLATMLAPAGIQLR
jgi:hypothetical protein